MRAEIRDLQSSEIVPIPADGIVFGREGSRAADLAVPDGGVSGRHARIFHESGVWFLEDLGSSNGTFVDGRRLDGKVQLEKGLRFSLSRYTYEVVSIGEAGTEADTGLWGGDVPPDVHADETGAERDVDNDKTGVIPQFLAGARALSEDRSMAEPIGAPAGHEPESPKPAASPEHLRPRTDPQVPPLVEEPGVLDNDGEGGPLLRYALLGSIVVAVATATVLLIWILGGDSGSPPGAEATPDRVEAAVEPPLDAAAPRTTVTSDSPSTSNALSTSESTTSSDATATAPGKPTPSDGTTMASGKPTASDAPAATDGVPEPAEAAYGDYVRKLARIEKTVKRNRGILKKKGAAALYKELQQATRQVEKKFAKKSGKKGRKRKPAAPTGVDEKLMRAELYEQTNVMVDELYGKLF